MPTSCSSYSLRQFTWEAHNRATVTQLPSKHAGSNPEAFRAHGQLWPLRPVCSQNRAGLCMSDPTFRFRSSKDRPYHIVQNRPGSDLDGLVRVWPNGSGVPESGSKPVCRNHGVRFWQNSTNPLPVSHFQTRLRFSTEGPDHIVQNQPGSDLVLADCLRF